MQGLYPIIRRKRRPLILDDVPPVVLGNVEPVQPQATGESREGREGETSDAKVPPTLDA